jgi:hypothetical protein
MKRKKFGIFVSSLLGSVKCAEDSARYNCLPLQIAVVSDSSAVALAKEDVLSGMQQR